MKEGTRKLIVSFALVAVVIWGAGVHFEPDEKYESDSVTEIGPAGDCTTGSESETAAAATDTRGRPWGADPFRSGRNKTAEPSRPDWLVTGIVYNELSPLAYVNGTLVRQGDTVDNAEVVRIERNAVILEHKGNRFHVSVGRG